MEDSNDNPKKFLEICANQIGFEMKELIEIETIFDEEEYPLLFIEKQFRFNLDSSIC